MVKNRVILILRYKFKYSNNRKGLFLQDYDDNSFDDFDFFHPRQNTSSTVKEETNIAICDLSKSKTNVSFCLNFLVIET